MGNVLEGNPYSRPQSGGFGGLFVLGGAAGAVMVKPPKGTFLGESASFEPLYVLLRRLIRAVRELEQREIKNKKHPNVLFTFMPGRHRSADCNQN
jgi:hypothetical protein